MEEERFVSKGFNRIFPISETHKYFKFLVIDFRILINYMTLMSMLTLEIEEREFVGLEDIARMDMCHKIFVISYSLLS